MKALIVVGVLACSCGCLCGAEFQSSRGFSLRYPDGWRVASNEVRQAVAEESRRRLMQDRGMKVEDFAIVLFDPKDDEFVENVNVIVKPGTFRVDENSLRDYRQEIQDALKPAGLSPTIIRIERLDINGCPALSAHSYLEFPGIAEPLRQWQVVIPGRGQVYTITCTGLKSNFREYEPRFQEIINSVKIDSGAMGWWYSLPAPLRAGLQFGFFGGIIGGAVGVLMWLFKKRANRAGAGATPNLP